MTPETKISHLRHQHYQHHREASTSSEVGGSSPNQPRFSQAETDLVLNKIAATTGKLNDVFEASRLLLEVKQRELKKQEDEMLAGLKHLEANRKAQLDVLRDEIKQMHSIVLSELQELKNSFLGGRRKARTGSGASNVDSPESRSTSLGSQAELPTPLQLVKEVSAEDGILGPDGHTEREEELFDDQDQDQDQDQDDDENDTDEKRPTRSSRNNRNQRGRNSEGGLASPVPEAPSLNEEALLRAAAKGNKSRDTNNGGTGNTPSPSNLSRHGHYTGTWPGKQGNVFSRKEVMTTAHDAVKSRRTATAQPSPPNVGHQQQKKGQQSPKKGEQKQSAAAANASSVASANKVAESKRTQATQQRQPPPGFALATSAAMVAAKKQQAQGVPQQLLQQSQQNQQGPSQAVHNAWFQPKPQQPSSSNHGNNQHSPQLPARIVFQPPPLGTGFALALGRVASPDSAALSQMLSQAHPVVFSRQDSRHSNHSTGGSSRRSSGSANISQHQQRGNGNNANGNNSSSRNQPPASPSKYPSFANVVSAQNGVDKHHAATYAVPQSPKVSGINLSHQQQSPRHPSLGGASQKAVSVLPSRSALKGLSKEHAPVGTNRRDRKMMYWHERFAAMRAAQEAAQNGGVEEQQLQPGEEGQQQRTPLVVQASRSASGNSPSGGSPNGLETSPKSAFTLPPRRNSAGNTTAANGKQQRKSQPQPQVQAVPQQQQQGKQQSAQTEKKQSAQQAQNQQLASNKQQSKPGKQGQVQQSSQQPSSSQQQPEPKTPEQQSKSAAASGQRSRSSKKKGRHGIQVPAPAPVRTAAQIVAASAHLPVTSKPQQQGQGEQSPVSRSPEQKPQQPQPQQPNQRRASKPAQQAQPVQQQQQQEPAQQGKQIAEPRTAPVVTAPANSRSAPAQSVQAQPQPRVVVPVQSQPRQQQQQQQEAGASSEEEQEREVIAPKLSRRQLARLRREMAAAQQQRINGLVLNNAPASQPQPQPQTVASVASPAKSQPAATTTNNSVRSPTTPSSAVPRPKSLLSPMAVPFEPQAKPQTQSQSRSQPQPKPAAAPAEKKSEQPKKKGKGLKQDMPKQAAVASDSSSTTTATTTTTTTDASKQPKPRGSWAALLKSPAS